MKDIKKSMGSFIHSATVGTPRIISGVVTTVIIYLYRILQVWLAKQMAWKTFERLGIETSFRRFILKFNN